MTATGHACTLTLPNGRSERFYTPHPATCAVLGQVADHDAFTGHHRAASAQLQAQAHAAFAALAHPTLVAEARPDPTGEQDTHCYHLDGVPQVSRTGNGDGYVTTTIRQGLSTHTKALPALPVLLGDLTRYAQDVTAQAVDHLALATRPVQEHFILTVHTTGAEADAFLVRHGHHYRTLGVTLTRAPLQVDNPARAHRREIHERITAADHDTRSQDPYVRAAGHDLRASAYADLAQHLSTAQEETTLATALARAAHADRAAAATTRFEHAIPTGMPLAEVSLLGLHQCRTCGRPWQRSSQGRCPHCPGLMFGPTPRTVEQARDYPDPIEVNLDDFARPALT